jgi:hypothetical protein
MRRLLIVGSLALVGYLLVRTRLPKLQERMMAKCAGMFEQMTGTSGAGGPCGGAQSPCSRAPSTEEVHDVA